MVLCRNIAFSARACSCHPRSTFHWRSPTHRTWTTTRSRPGCGELRRDVRTAVLDGGTTTTAPLVLPANFASGKYASPFEQLLAQDAEMQAQVEAYRATPVGAHALKVYEHR